jgi:hypothetical protein
MTRVEQWAQRGALRERDRRSDPHQDTRRIDQSPHGESASLSRVVCEKGCLGAQVGVGVARHA